MEQDHKVEGGGGSVISYRVSLTTSPVPSLHKVHSSRSSDREQQRLVCWHGIRTLYTTPDRPVVPFLKGIVAPD
jgi:hypothetical protein